MIDNSIVKLSLISSIIGILFIYISAAHMKPALTPISKIDEDFVGLKTKTSGKIIDIRTHQDGHLFAKIKDESGGEIKVPIFKRINSKLEDKIGLLDNIEVKGKVKKYKDQLEVIPESPESIKITHKTPTELSQVDKSKLGKIVKTRGYIAEKRTLKNGNLQLKLTKNKNKILALIPKNIASSKNFPIQENNIIQIAGPVQNFEDTLRIKVEDPNNIKINGAS